MGLATLEPLRELDEVAYLRFASVYQAFDSLEDFESAITLLRAEHAPTGVEPARGGPPLDAVGGGRWGRHPPPMATTHVLHHRHQQTSASRQITLRRPMKEPRGDMA